MNRRAMIAMAGMSGLSWVPVAHAEEATPATAAANESIAREYIERVWNDGDAAAIDELIAENYLPPNPSDAPGRDAFRARWQTGRDALKSALPDLRYSVEVAIGSGNFVSLRGTISGTTTSGDMVNTWYLSMVEIHDGRITTEWALVNQG
jgi:predicted SnoaL-like aldol condensation-catalyzing enzyme